MKDETWQEKWELFLFSCKRIGMGIHDWFLSDLVFNTTLVAVVCTIATAIICLRLYSRRKTKERLNEARPHYFLPVGRLPAVVDAVAEKPAVGEVFKKQKQVKRVSPVPVQALAIDGCKTAPLHKAETVKPPLNKKKVEALRDAKKIASKMEPKAVQVVPVAEAKPAEPIVKKKSPAQKKKKIVPKKKQEKEGVVVQMPSSEASTGAGNSQTPALPKTNEPKQTVSA